MTECSARFDIAEKALYNELNKTLRNNFKSERRNNDLMAYTETKEKHEALSKELIDQII